MKSDAQRGMIPWRKYVDRELRVQGLPTALYRLTVDGNAFRSGYVGPLKGYLGCATSGNLGAHLRYLIQGLQLLY